MKRRVLAVCGFAWPLFSGCIVAPCPRGIVCGVVAETGGATGAGGTDTGGKGSTDGGNDAGDRKDDANVAEVGAGGTANIPTAPWVNVTGSLANMASDCGNMTDVSAKPDEDLLIAGIALDGLWSSKDGGASWQPMGTGAGSASITNRPTAIVYDPSNTKRFWASGIYSYASSVVNVTSDDGVTFSGLGSFPAPPVGNAFHADLVSVDFGDPDRKTLLAGGHEQARTVDLSVDQGVTWTNVGLNLPETNDVCTFPLILDSTTFLVGCSNLSSGVPGILRSTNAGKTWVRLTSSVGGASAPLRASDGTIYWTTAGGGLAKSVDDGKTFTELPGSDVVQSPPPSELPDGSIVVLGRDYLMRSSNHGATWRAISAELPYQGAVGLTYSAQRKAFYIWHFDCGKVVLPDAIMRYDFDYTKD